MEEITENEAKLLFKGLELLLKEQKKNLKKAIKKNLSKSDIEFIEELINKTKALSKNLPTKEKIVFNNLMNRLGQK